ncbi:YjcQ family protein [Peribacillus simplex]|uniref:YjcQ family protein n=1 Tax=Peribacillus simplex TaxID=1478 RepID=UPI003CED7C9E
MEKLRLMYKILSEIDKGVEVSKGNYEVSNDLWGEIAEILLDEGLANGISVTRGGRGNKVLIVWYKGATITLKGLMFLKDNDALAY